MSQPRKRKRIPYPSPEALAAHDRKLSKEYALTKIELQVFSVAGVKGQSQAHTYSHDLVDVEHPRRVAITLEEILQKETPPPTMEVKQTLSQASPVPLDIRADSALVKQRYFGENSPQKSINKSVDTSIPEQSDKLVASHVAIPTWKRSTASTSLSGKVTKPTRKIQTPPFTVSRKGVQAGHVYNVKYRFEKGSSVGDAWQQVEKQISFYEVASQFTKTEYAVGDVLTITFPSGPGGYAKLVEIRGTCIEDLFIVVQWLYTRTDIASMGGEPPPLEHWPEDKYVLTDHFQVLGVENIENKKGPAQLEHVYWRLSESSLRPLNEINLKLEKQLA